jgi:hypothetical protein
MKVDPVHRDSPHHVPAHVVVLHRLRRLFGVRHSHVLHKGAHHPVNAHWHAANTAPWPHLAGRSRHELRGIQDELLFKSNHLPLTAEELAYLRAANNHFDVRTCIDWLQGRSHSEFGFTGVDQVHGMYLRPVIWNDDPSHELGGKLEACGCVLALVQDHHKARAGVQHEIHKHGPMTTACEVHAPHARDLDRLHARTRADSEAAYATYQERKAQKTEG